MVLKLERDITPLKMISTPAEDVLAILKRQRGFWKRRSKFEPIEEEGPGKPKRGTLISEKESLGNSLNFSISCAQRRVRAIAS